MSDNQQFCLRWNNHQSTLVQVIDSLLSSGVLVDCTLAAEGQYLHAHKVVLCACSPYLETLLSQHYEKHPIVILKDVKFQELKSMMDYMYKGEVNISQDQLGQFLKAAESLQIKGLTDGGGGENDAKDVGTAAHNKRHDPPPIRKSVPPNQSRSSVVLPSHSAGLTIEPSKRTIPSHLSESQPDSPIRSREGSSSPTPRKRRRPRRPSQGDDDGHQDNCDLPMQQQSILNTVPIIPQLPAGSSSTITKAPPPDDEPDQPAESDVRLAESGLLKEKIEPQSELLIEPKTEYMEETNNDDSVEDLTLDDDDEYDNMDGAGPSHGGDNSNQSYGQWQMGERTHDDVFMAAQEAVGGGPRDSQECIRVKTEPNDVEMCSPLALQLNNSDWSISPSSGSLSDDNVLSPVSENEVESVAEDVEGSNILSPVSVNGVENTVEDVEGSRTVEFSSSAIADNAADASSCNGMIVDIASNAAISQVPETNEQFEEELLADSAIHPSVENGPKVCQMIVENNHSEVVNGPTDMIHSEDDLSDIELCLESPIASPHPSNHVTDTHQTDQHNVPKLVEVIALEQKEAEIDCGVEPLSDRLTTSESSPSPVSISPPPRHIVTPAEMVDEFIASAPWKNPPTKQTSAKSKTQAEVVKHGSVIIRARGKILRKSSRKKNLTNKKLTARRRDSFQEYLEQAFDLKPFMIRLDRHRNESEINESEKLHFLSNFHLKKKSVFPLYSEHQKKRAEFNSPRRKPPLKAKRSKNKKEGTTKPNAVARKRTTPKPDLSRYSRCIQGVIIERWDENAYRRPIEIHDEHSYNFRENENERRLSTDFSLRV